MKLFLATSLTLHNLENDMLIPLLASVVHVWIRRGAAAPPLVRTALVRPRRFSFLPTSHHHRSEAPRIPARAPIVAQCVQNKWEKYLGTHMIEQLYSPWAKDIFMIFYGIVLLGHVI